MAFSGRPSKACANCRQRRIKCNLAEPECAQCRRAGKECPGYRDQLALLFRSENEKVLRKAQGHPSPVEGQKGKSVERQLQDIGIQGFKLAVNSKSTLAELQIRLHASRSPIPASPSTPLYVHDPGIVFFFQTYMKAVPAAPSGQPDIFSSHLWRGVSQTGHFVDAISSVGLAGLSNVNNDPEVMTIARQKYGITLQRIVASLRAPRNAEMGYTLKAVKFLALFEMIDCDMPTAGLWGVHLDGVAALLTSEKFRQVQSEFGSHVKRQFFFTMFIKYIQNGQKCPASFANWALIWTRSLCDVESPVAPLTELIMQFLDLNANVTHGITIDANSILREALEMDNALEDWKLHLPPEWRYEVVASTEKLGTYNGQYHIYSDQWIAQMWNHYRWLRILVHEVILTQLNSLPFVPLEMREQKSISLGIIGHIASQVCAGVFSQLHLPNNGIPDSTPHWQMNNVFVVLWPLQVVGSAIGVSESLYKWILDTLEGIGQTKGIRQTKLIILSMLIQREYWKSTGAYCSGEQR